MVKEQSRKATIVVTSIKGRIYQIIGYFFAIPLGLTLCFGIATGEFYYNTDALVAVLVVFLPFFLLARRGSKLARLASRFRKYVGPLSTDPQHSLQYVSYHAGVPYGQVVKDMELMIKKKFFVKAYIDYGSGCVVFPGMRSSAATAATEYAPSGSPPPEPVTVTCKGCGAANRMQAGTAHECEYCGSPLA